MKITKIGGETWMASKELQAKIPNATHYIETLRKAGFVRKKKVKNKVYWQFLETSIMPEPLTITKDDIKEIKKINKKKVRK